MKRRLLIVLCLLCMLMNLLAFSVSAETSGDCGDNATWSLSDDGVLTISGSGAIRDYIYEGANLWPLIKAPWREYNSKIKKIVINSGITRIGDNAFCCLPNVTSVSIPGTVVSIGQAAFCDDSSLDNVTIPNSVTTIEQSAFQRCRALSRITLPSNLKILEGGCFENCAKLANIELPNSITEIDAWTFAYCANLTNITIPEGVTSIENFAFGYSGLTSIKLPESLQKIAPNAFNASNLTQITIPANVAHIMQDAFAGCHNLKRVQFMGSAPSFDSHVFNTITTTAYYPNDNSSWTEAVRQNYGGTVTWVAYCGNGHTWGQWEIERETSCSKEGLTVRKCTQCDVTEEKSIAKTAHQYTETVIPPTCKEGGYTKHTCKVCGNQYTDNKTAPGTHTYRDEITASNCIQQGFTTHICTVCQHTLVDTYTDISEHTFGEWVVLKESTCLEKGSRQHSCTVCQLQEEEETDLVGHAYQDEITAPSCTKQGYTTHVCTVCQYAFVDTYTDITEHTYGEWTEIKPATWREEGKQHRQCVDCTEEQTEVLPKLPINWGMITGVIAVGIAVVGAAIILIKKRVSK